MENRNFLQESLNYITPNQPPQPKRTNFMQKICTPAAIYLVFSLVQIIMDLSKGLYNQSLLKMVVAVIFTLLLNGLCARGLGIISWMIVFVPFIFMSVITAILLFVFGLDPATGKIKSTNQPAEDTSVAVPPAEDTSVAVPPAEDT